MLSFDWVITSKYVDAKTINNRLEEGWAFIATLPAKIVHPHALEDDKITLFSRYEPYEREDSEAEVTE